MEKDPKLVVVGIVIAALVVAGIAYATTSKEDPGTCDLTEASLALVAAGLQKDHSAEEIITEAGAGFIATKACDTFVKTAVERPTEAQQTEVREADGVASTESASGLELAKSEEVKHARMEALIKRAGVCFAYKDSIQYMECLEGRVNP